MPTLNRAPNEKELEKLISIFLKAETDIINEIGRLRARVYQSAPVPAPKGAGTKIFFLHPLYKGAKVCYHHIVNKNYYC